MRIRLIEPAPPSIHMWSYSAYPRLGLPMIGAAARDAGHDVRIYMPQMAPVDWDDVRTADLVGISATTSTAPAAYAMADELRAHGVPVVIGGSHVTFMADEALEHAEYVARGEGGEELLLELIGVMHGRRTLDSVRGLSFRRDGRAVHNPLREPCDDLDALPFPDFSLMAGSERLQSLPTMTSWGCPFDCNFCSVTAMFGKKYRFRSSENVVAELESRRPRWVFFYDDNLAANKARLKRLLRLMIEHHLVVPWQTQLRTDVARDPELLDLMKRSGCDRVALGLESINQETLDGFEKSQTVDDIVAAITALHEHGIKVHGMFVLGADTDDARSVRQTVEFARRHGIDSLMLNILTPLPGTALFDQMDAEGRIFDRRWQLYDAQHVVFRPRQMTPEMLMRETLRAYRRFYSSWRLIKDVLTGQWGLVKEHAWCWWFVRSWHRNRENREHLRMLGRLKYIDAARGTSAAGGGAGR